MPIIEPRGRKKEEVGMKLGRGKRRR